MTPAADDVRSLDPSPEASESLPESIERADRERERLERRVEFEEESRRIRLEEWDAFMRREYPRMGRPTLADVAPAIRKDIDEWLSRRDGGNLILMGKTGTGKTHTAFAVMREFHARRKTTKFWPMPNLFDAIRPGGDEHAFQQAREVDLLVYDDLTVDRPTDWTYERLYIIVNDRWMKALPGVVTCNLTPPELEEALGPRMYSRLTHNSVAVILGGQDRRTID